MTIRDARRVQVWFGNHVIATYVAERLLADQYAAAMGRRFAGLRITNEPLPPNCLADADTPSRPSADPDRTAALAVDRALIH